MSGNRDSDGNTVQQSAVPEVDSSSGTAPPSWLGASRRKRGIKDGEPVAGLALSGGGIRSATFNLGLIRALAQSEVFNRFDYLSTVSGGGYAGAAVGKLFNPPSGDPGLPEAEKQPRSAPAQHAPGLEGLDASWFIWWLRATSRYLTPRGFTDIVRALATYMRSMLGVHFEAAVLGVAIGCLMALYNIFVWKSLSFTPAALAPFVNPLVESSISSWWLLGIVPVSGALIFVFAYWQVRREGTDSQRRRIDTAGLAFVLIVLLVVLLDGPYIHLVPLESNDVKAVTVIACWLLALAGIAPMAATYHDRLAGGSDPVQRAAKARNTLTKGLSWMLAAIAALFILGVLDRLAWWFAFGEAWNWRVTQTVAGIVAASLLVARLTATATAREVSAENGAASTGANSTISWVGALGMLVGFVLLALWVGVAYQWVLGALFPVGLETTGSFRAAAWTGAVTFIVLALYLYLTGSGAGFVNQSSLHMFYRARLARSYLGASNSARFTPESEGSRPYHPLDAVPEHLRSEGANRKTVFDVDPGDLVTLANYRPHEGGGPVHIVNMTLNQTVDPAGGLFNQDRKGEYLSVTTGGWSRLGTRAWRHEPAFAGDDLATWIAVSGAAAAPGLGAQTSKGLALLCFLAGVRLGFWWDSLAGHRHAATAKYKLFLHEMLANFPGARGRYWFLSDGGHFDNTGAYALLRERAQLIVLADCGADPDYDFKDIENLVRKARIDLQTDIQFLRPTDAVNGRPDLQRFGTLRDLADPGGNECLAIASVHYPTADGQRAAQDQPADGYLVLVKPNIFHGLPVDILRYKQDNSKFPQETTTDQFFSESQWESYYRLGAKLGESITPEFLNMLSQPMDASLFVADLPPAVAPSQTPEGSDKEIAVAAAAAVTAVREIPLRREPRLRRGLGFTALLAALLCGGGLWYVHAEMEKNRIGDLRRDTSATEAIYEASDAQCSAVRESFVTLADKWCEKPGGRVELGKLRDRYDALSNGCGNATDSSCTRLKQQQTRSCYSGGASAERAVLPVYWALPSQPIAYTSRAPKCLAEPAPTPPAANLDVPAAKKPYCADQTIYVHVFGSNQTVKASKLTEEWLKDMNIKPEIEDLLSSAQKRGHKPPPVVGRDVVLYGDEEDLQCASVLWSKIGDEPVMRMQEGGKRGAIEVWLKPRP